VVRLGAPLSTDCVSPRTNPVTLYVRVGFAEPANLERLFALTVSNAFVMVNAAVL